MSLIIVKAMGQQGAGGQEAGNESFYAGEVARMIKIPNSPEAEAFAKYGDTQVNMFSGVPEISIPLHTIAGQELDIPISLTYDASGILVEQKANWVGLSWNLNVGGRISRIVNGLPDDYFERGVVNTGYPYRTMFNDKPSNIVESVNWRAGFYANNYAGRETPQFPSFQAAKDYYEFLFEANRNTIDTQPDYFTLNVMGLNETITFHRIGDDNIPQLMNNSRIMVEPAYGTFTDYNGQNLDYISSWKITGEDGTEYFFDLMEETTRDNQDDLEFPLGDIGITKYGSSWVLTKIISKNRKDTYNFGYTSRFSDRPSNLPSTATTATTQIIDDNSIQIYPQEPIRYSNIQSSVKKMNLRTIRRNGVLVASIGVGARYDVSSEAQNSRLAEIDFFDSSGGDLKTVVFHNEDYFNLDGATPNALSASGKSYSDVRLKLNGLSVKGKDNTTYQDYHFSYIRPDDLPDRGSRDQDYLGYYNGAGNSTIYPAYESGGVTFLGANRELNCQFSMIGLLNQITYPTGGRTVYTYESHDEYQSITENGETLVDGFMATENTNVEESIFEFDNGNRCLDVSPLPKVLIKAFKISETKNYIIEHQSANGRIVIVDLSLGTKKFDSYCDFEAVGGYKVWPKTTGDNSILQLEEGHTYKILVQSNFGSDDGYQDVFLNIKSDFSNTIRRNVNIGGHRIAKITDYADDQTVALTKYYSYEEDGKSTSTVNYIPQGLADIPIITNADNQGNSNTKRLIRHATKPIGATPYVVYSAVSEIKVDGSGGALGRTTYKFYGGKKGATPRADPPFENYFANNLRTGNLREKIVRDHSDQIVYRDSIGYSETYDLPTRNVGLTVLTAEEHFGHFILMQEYYPGTSSSFFAPVYREAFEDCGGSAGGTTLGNKCPVPAFWNDPLKLDFPYAWLGARKNTASAIYGGVASVKTETTFVDNNSNVNVVTSEELTEYDTTGDHRYLPRKKRLIDSKGDVYETAYTYPFEMTGIAYDSLVRNNNLVEVVKSKTTKNPDTPLEAKVMSLRENEYSIFQPGDESIVLPTLVKMQKGEDNEAGVEDRIIFDFYLNGNLKTAKQVNGPITVYLWGYDQMYPVAKIENATYGQVQSVLDVGAEFDAGSLGLTPQQETDLRNGLPKAMVSTYAYSPSVGVTRMTDPRGYMITYEYDSFNRLKAVRDDAGELVTDYEYGYKQATSN